MVAQGLLYRLRRESPLKSVGELPKQLDDTTEDTTKDDPTAPMSAVRFDDNVTFHTVLGRRQYSKKEKKACFWTAKDLSNAKRSIRTQVEQVESGCKKQQAKIDPDELSTIDRFLTKTTIERERVRNESIRIILKYQSLKGRLDDYWMKHCYIPSTKAVTKSAHIRAIAEQQSHLSAAPYNQIIIR
eukprot:scaffold7414_cov116-Cylindrotheca_fusiformis.AAC.4